jgi:hypothetical protein
VKLNPFAVESARDYGYRATNSSHGHRRRRGRPRHPDEHRHSHRGLPARQKPARCPGSHPEHQLAHRRGQGGEHRHLPRFPVGAEAGRRGGRRPLRHLECRPHRSHQGRGLDPARARQRRGRRQCHLAPAEVHARHPRADDGRQLRTLLGQPDAHGAAGGRPRGVSHRRLEVRPARWLGGLDLSQRVRAAGRDHGAADEEPRAELRLPDHRSQREQHPAHQLQPSGLHRRRPRGRSGATTPRVAPARPACRASASRPAPGSTARRASAR